MAVRSGGALPADLAKARKRFVAWRRQKTPRERIPAALWKTAVKLVGSHGLNGVAAALKLDYYALKQHVERARDPDGSGNAPFLEVVAAPRPAEGECIIELEDGAGASLRVTLRGHAPPDLAALVRGFWNAD